MLYGSDAHQALSEKLTEQDGPGVWVYNRNWGGMFGGKRPDYLNLLHAPIPAYELKPLGQDVAAKRQLDDYLKIGGPGFAAGGPRLVFRDRGSLSAESEGLLGGNEYDYFPGKFSGTLGYTMHDREGKLQELGKVLLEGLKRGLSQPPMTMLLTGPTGSNGGRSVAPPPPRWSWFSE
jgi:hypothetical protein